MVIFGNLTFLKRSLSAYALVKTCCALLLCSVLLASNTAAFAQTTAEQDHQEIIQQLPDLTVDDLHVLAEANRSRSPELLQAIIAELELRDINGTLNDYERERKTLLSAYNLLLHEQEIYNALRLYRFIEASENHDIKVESLSKQLNVALLTGNIHAGSKVVDLLTQLGEEELSPRERSDMFATIAYFMFSVGNLEGAVLYQRLLDRNHFNAREKCTLQVNIEITDMHFYFAKYDQQSISQVADYCISQREYIFASSLAVVSARLFNDMGLADQALSLLDKYKDAIFKHNLIDHRIIYYNEMSRIYQQKQQYDKAQAMADNTLELLLQAPNITIDLEKVLKQLSDFAYQQQQFDLALDLQQRYLATQEDQLNMLLQRELQLAKVMQNIHAMQVLSDRKANVLMDTREKFEQVSNEFYSFNDDLISYGGILFGLGLIALLIYIRQVRLRSLGKVKRQAWKKDILTGLLSRRYLHEQIYSSYVNIKVDKINYAGMQLRLKGMRRFNRRYGYRQGDEVLKMVAKLLLQHQCKKHHVGRTGSNEFTLVRHDILIVAMQEIAHKIDRQYQHMMVSMGYSKDDLALYIGLTDSITSDFNPKYFFTDMSMAMTRAEWGEKNIVTFRVDWTDRRVFFPTKEEQVWR